MFHEDGREFSEVCRAASSRDVLESGAPEDGMDRVAHFVEEGREFGEGEE